MTAVLPPKAVIGMVHVQAVSGALLHHVDGVIVGSAIKVDGRWDNPPDPERCRALIDAANAARGD